MISVFVTSFLNAVGTTLGVGIGLVGLVLLAPTILKAFNTILKVVKK